MTQSVGMQALENPIGTSQNFAGGLPNLESLHKACEEIVWAPWKEIYQKRNLLALLDYYVTRLPGFFTQSAINVESALMPGSHHHEVSAWKVWLDH